MVSMSSFVVEYKKYLEDYLLKGGDDEVLFKAYQNLLGLLDESSAQAASLLDIHNQVLKNVLNIRQDNDMVQWLYIERATEFLAQILIATDAVLLSLRERIERDVLTGLYNKLAVKRILSKAWSDAHTIDTPLAGAMLDIDNFKEINDSYGHLVGDELLKEISYIIRRSLREGDVAIRYGGEEFFVLLPKTDSKGAKIPLERLRKRVEEETFTDSGIKVTISIGVSVHPDDELANVEELIKFADAALYEAKKRGKNMVVFYSQLGGKGGK